MHVTLQMALVLAVVCAAWCEPAGPGRAARAKQPRATRGFKNTEMMTARGFGKRNYHAPRSDSIRKPRSTRVFRNSDLSVARAFGKRNVDADEKVFALDNFWDLLEASQEKGQLERTDDKSVDSVPVEWFAEELINSPELAKTVVRKFLDLNQDGNLSPDELLRNAY